MTSEQLAHTWVDSSQSHRKPSTYWPACREDGIWGRCVKKSTTGGTGILSSPSRYQDTCRVSTMRRSYGPHMPEQRHLLFTSVDPQSATSSHRGGKLRG